MAVTLYRQVGKGKARRYQKVDLGRGRRPADLTGPYFLRYSLPDGTRPWEPVGDDLDEAIAARDRKQAFRGFGRKHPGRSRPGRRWPDEDHGCSLSMVHRASAFSGQRPTRQEREDTAGLQLAPRILPRLH